MLIDLSIYLPRGDCTMCYIAFHMKKYRYQLLLWVEKNDIRKIDTLQIFFQACLKTFKFNINGVLKHEVF